MSEVKAFKYADKQSYLNFIDKYATASNAATGSEVDANANVERKTIASMETELYKAEGIRINRLAMQQRLYELFGSRVSEKYIDDLENHKVYRHDETAVVGKPYCASITLYPFLLNGLKGFDGSSGAPNNLDSFCGGFINLVYNVSSQLAGAVATPEFLAYMDHFIRKDYGDDYYKHIDDVVDMSSRHRTIDKIITDCFEQVVYSINQPSSARGAQSCFWNIAYFSKQFFDGMFEDFVFPDGDEMCWESVSWLQKRFMKWFNQERTKKILTFPVESLQLVDDGEKYLDEEWADFAAEMWSEGHSFFMYRSDSVDSLSSCCFDGDTEVLVKSSNLGVQKIPIKEWHELKWEPFKKNQTVFHDGSWVKAKTIKVKGSNMYKVTTTNNKSIVVTDNHLHPILRDRKETNVRTDALNEDDYMLFNNSVLDAVPESDKHLSYAEGFLIGAYLGDGSMDNEEESYQTTVVFSMNKEKIEACSDLFNEALTRIGESKKFSHFDNGNNCESLTIISDKVASFIRDWVSGNYCYNKELNLNCLLQSVEFRRGIFEGLYSTDGGNSNRIYSTSKELVGQMETLFTSLGIQTIIDCSDRTDEPVIIRGEEYKRNYPLYCIRWYSQSNKRTMKDVYQKKNGRIYFKIKNIEKIDDDNPDFVYCFERADKDEPYFTLPNGIITHNCRLRNEITDNQFSYTLGAGGISTGSKCVMTINMNRLVQDFIKETPRYKAEDYHASQEIREEMQTSLNLYLAEQVSFMHLYLKGFNTILLDRMKAGLLPIYDAGFVNPDRQYLTIGINGMNEAAEYLGCSIKSNDECYKFFVNNMLNTINAMNKMDKTEDCMFNTEYVPA